MTRHVLVTGGAGFIGSHLADAFIARGDRVSIIDNLSTGDLRNLNPKAEFHEADLREERTFELVRSLKPDLVSHHAAQIDVRHSVADPAIDAEINIVATIRLLQASLDAGVQRFVFASTGGAIYGEPVTTPQDEEHPRNPLSPYGCAKLSVEHYLHYFREVHGLPAVALRYANIYGPRQNSKGEAGVIAIFADRLLRGEDVTINGDGEQTRDYVFVDDVVRANLVVCDDASLAGPYNVGAGIESSVNELYRLIAANAGVDRDAHHGPAKVGEQRRSVLDGTKLRAIGKLPEPLSLRDGIRQTVEWFRGSASSRVQALREAQLSSE
jgi:UDP-glucose 4-epimerase